MKIVQEENCDLPKSNEEDLCSFPCMMFKYKNFQQNDREYQESFDENCKQILKSLLCFKFEQDFSSKNLYFNSEQEFKFFVGSIHQKMTPITLSWCSNLNGSAIRCRVYTVTHNQQNCDEANKNLKILTQNSFKYLYLSDCVRINTIEQMRLLYAASVDLESIYFSIPKRICIDITKYSINGIKQEVPNMNMFFNHYLGTIVDNCFNYGAATFCAEYPDEIQVLLKDQVIQLCLEISKRNRDDYEKYCRHANDCVKFGMNKIRNIKASFLDCYMYKKKKFKDGRYNQNYSINSHKISECLRILFDLVYPLAKHIINYLSCCYQSSGYSIADNNTCTPFKDIAALFCSNNYLNNWISKLDISLPGYDSKIPAVCLEYREGTYDEILKRYLQANIISFEEYPCLNEFREFLSLDIFSKDHFSIDEPNNSFTLRNCW